jgi:hypothetical protein
LLGQTAEIRREFRKSRKAGVIPFPAAGAAKGLIAGPLAGFARNSPARIFDKGD